MQFQGAQKSNEHQIQAFYSLAPKDLICRFYVSLGKQLT